RLTEADLAGFDRGLLQCSESRVVGHGGVYACPLLAGLPGARLTEGTLKESFADAPLYHPASMTCVQTGVTCKNGKPACPPRSTRAENPEDHDAANDGSSSPRRLQRRADRPG